MKIRLLVTLFSVLFLFDQVLADADNEKRGLYPYMALLYYSDASVTDPSGARFLRGAVLVKPDWLVTSSIGPAAIADLPNGFPRKTLLARLGAVSIDDKLTLNEDEYEQEGEVIQIVHPHNQSATQWWRTDIALLKTLMPFNLSASVNTAKLRSSSSNKYADCFMLVFARSANSSRDRSLVRLSVELTKLTNPMSCGNHFHQDTMLCGNGVAGNKIQTYDPNYCQENSGGPLVCDNEITGLQTYIENNCKPPYLYQRLSAWSKFISCVIEDECQTDRCAQSCKITYKDDQPKVTATGVSSELLTSDSTTKQPPMSLSTNKLEHYEDVVLSSLTNTPITEDETEVKPTQSRGPTVSLESTVSSASTVSLVTTKPSEATNVLTQMKSNDDKTPGAVEETTTDRKVNVEAQRQDVVKKARGVASRNMVFQSLVSVPILACLM